MAIETINSASEFLFENDAQEILLNNLLSFNERTETIINLTADIERYGTDAQKHYLPYFKSAFAKVEATLKNKSFGVSVGLPSLSRFKYLFSRTFNPFSLRVISSNNSVLTINTPPAFYTI